MRRAFVSHSTADDRYVAEMESFLRAAGFDEVFNDVSAIRPDEEFWPEIENGIGKCDSFVVVITAASNASEWVKREVEYARGLSKQIIPVWVEDCPLPSTFADRDVIDFRPRIRGERRFDIDRILKYAPAVLIGREEETKLLNDAWEKVLRIEKGRPHILTFVALGGEGKTSLVAKWAADLAHQDWPGCDAAFAWSFYSQGTREQLAASSDLFLKEALTFFGDDADKAFAASPAGAFEKGQRLARIVGQRRNLLILDGLEPLQYAPTSPTPGQLKDYGIAALLRGLAATSHGLCIVTTRYSLPDLRAFWQTTAPEVKLLRLSRQAGVHLLQSFGVQGSLLPNIPFHREQVNEFEKLVEDVQGHALTLNLLSTYLRDAHAGDIRKRDLVKLEEADAEEQGGHAFRAMEAYEREFEREGDKGQRALAVLRLLGLFDRPLTSDCAGALLQAPTIPELTEPLVDLTDAQRNLVFTRLENARLLTVNRDTAGTLVTLDAHPLLREYFARQLRTQQPDAWRAAHRRLYEHFCKHKEGDQPTLEDLQPLYQAVAHGCQAGLHQHACDSVYYARILRGNENFSSWQLGAFGLNLAAVACFFECPWNRVSPGLNEFDQAWVLNGAATSLHALGRLIEAVELTRASLKMRVQHGEWANVAIAARNLSDSESTLGRLAQAVLDAEVSMNYGTRSGDMLQWVDGCTTYADALHQAGSQAEAKVRFREAEQQKALCAPNFPQLQSVTGFRYCDLLLGIPERVAWQAMLWSAALSERPAAAALPDQHAPHTSSRASTVGPAAGGPADTPGLLECLHAVSQRAAQTLKWAEATRMDMVSIALDHLTLGRVALCKAVLTAPGFPLKIENLKLKTSVDSAVNGLRRANSQDQIPRGLLTRAWLRFLTGARTGPESAKEDLDEAWEIAERGPMKLHMADIHLYRARLFGRSGRVISNQFPVISGEKYPWESPAADLAAAEKLINDCGYHRRDEELADAKKAILDSSPTT